MNTKVHTMDLFEQLEWRPLASLGISHHFFSLNGETIIYTWIALGIILALLVIGRLGLKNPKSLLGYATLKYIRAWHGMIEQSVKQPQENYTTFAISLFTFLLICNCIIIIPTFEEPTRDLNTTFALSLIAFWYTQRESLRMHGIVAYANEFFKTPLQISGLYNRLTPWTISMIIIRILANGIIGCLLLPIELLSKFATILSLSFRLFGNIFAGSMIGGLYTMLKTKSLAWQLIGLVTGFNLFLLLFFGIFEGLIQAGIFTVLTIAYLGMAVNDSHEASEAA